MILGAEYISVVCQAVEVRVSSQITKKTNKKAVEIVLPIYYMQITDHN